MLLITPFDTLRSVARAHYPGFLVGLLLREQYDSATALQAYRGPVGILLAERDEVVPAERGQALFDGYAGPKRLWVQAGRTHNSIDYHPDAAWWREAVAFLREAAPAGSAAD